MLAEAPTPGNPLTRRARWLLLPVALWFAATLFLRGDLGKWNDDYFFLGQFDSATGAVKSYTLDRPLHFWRPVYRYVATPLITALFHHDRALHVVSAVVHGLVCLLLYGLLRRLHLSRPASGLAAMLMLVWPSHYEVAFWNTCSFTAVATAGCLSATWLYMNWLERRRRGHGAWLPVWTAPPIMAALGFLVAATNEQPAAAFVALGLLGLALVVAPPTEAARLSIARSGGRFRALVRAAAPVIGAGIGLGAYVIVQVRRYPPSRGGSIGSNVELVDMPRRLAGLAAEVWSHLVLNGVRSDAFRFGIAALRADPLLAALAAAAVVAGAALWVRASAPAASAAQHPARPAWRVWLIVFGAAWFVVCWLPIARIVYPASPRLFYAPCAGLAIAVGAALDLAIGSVRHPPRWRARISLAAIGLMFACAVCMIGVQRAFHLRWHADQDQARQLVALVPDPPRRAIFVPIRVVDRLGGAERTPFTRRFYPPLHSSWAGGWWLQMAYRRHDVFAAQAIGPWDRVPLTSVNVSDEWPNGRAMPLNPMMPPFRRRARSGAAFAWEKVIPFEIDDHGRVHVFTSVRIELGEGKSATLDLTRNGVAPALPARELDVRATGARR